ncbi:hypothetical protein K9M78_05955 [Candidatus Bipolaricaulota bacterium]|nr:hypothetical protein [Candidatus Bipolaricaulota bacterium]
MNFGFTIWIFFFLVFILPQFNHWMTQKNRQSQLNSFATKRGSNVITMIHRQEKVSFFGIPFYKYIDMDDSEAVLRAIRKTPDDKPIDLILHTPGGLVLPATQIALALNDHPAETRILIPHYAMSGGTLLALACNEVIMDPHAVLGPVDPQIQREEGTATAASSILAADKEKGKDAEDETLMLADISEKAVSQMKNLVNKLTDNPEIVDKLVSGQYTHDYPITPDKAVDFGIPVKTELPDEVYNLMDLYPQTKGGKPSVEYFPSRPTQEQ